MAEAGRAPIRCILVNYRNADDTLAALASVEPSVRRGAIDITVVDNESTESSRACLRQSPVPFTLIVEADNTGFAAAVNRAVSLSAGDTDSEFIWLLNNDCVADDGAATALQEVLERDPTCAAASSLVLYSDGTERVWCADGRLIGPGLIVRHGGKGRPARFSKQHDAARVTFVSGCSVMIRRSAWDAVGGFDSSLFLYGEDVDLSLKLRQAGHSLRFAPRSRVWHKVSVASGGEYSLQREYYLTRNSTHLVARWSGSSMERVVGLGMRWCWDALRIARACLRTDVPLTSGWRTLRGAVQDGLAGRLGRFHDELQEAG
ncbi:MAG: glycosyltransferase family 2 protein [Bdellovibrionales bacterium]|nr:glycosyltransferase family 2 protein [Bdellovibrionales bacterium]